LLVAGCASDRDQHHYFHAKEQPHPTAWGYAGNTGPEHWGDLSPEYALAKTGKAQSPIDIRDATTAHLPGIRFDYHPATINLVYNGHTIEEKEEDQASSIEIDGVKYTLEQFHFHAPSEHTISGGHTEMEMHLVHKSASGAVAVVGVLVQAGAENRAFAPVWDNLPTAANKSRRSAVTVDVDELLPSGNRAYYRYMGSFTTPPCTEDVLWLILQQPVELSAAQIAKFKAVIQGNNRPVQPRTGRALQRAG
jgi:carbonic anhydrase